MKINELIMSSSLYLSLSVHLSYNFTMTKVQLFPDCLCNHFYMLPSKFSNPRFVYTCICLLDYFPTKKKL